MNGNGPERTRGWQLRGQKRPDWAVKPRPGQESVWDYPRPPLIVADTRLVQVRLHDTLIAETRNAVRVLETASPPTFYLPPQSVRRDDALRKAAGSTCCEWKGRSVYYNVCTKTCCVERAAWSYPEPHAGFEAITNYLAFYPGRLECFVEGERVLAQAGEFYGGWITAEIVGPFKGEPGTSGW